jgi:template-activating factor I
MKINWKSDEKNLTKLYPREMDPEDQDDVAEPGSFFNFFEHENDPMQVSDTIQGLAAPLVMEMQMAYDSVLDQIGGTIANEVFPEAIEYFLGNVGGEELDSEDEEDDDDDDDDDAEEIDLEKPRSKKRRV